MSSPATLDEATMALGALRASPLRSLLTALGCGLDVIPARVPAWSVALALGTAAAAGLLFGIYPAARASRLDPAEAMRTE